MAIERTVFWGNASGVGGGMQPKLEKRCWRGQRGRHSLSNAADIISTPSLIRMTTRDPVSLSLVRKRVIQSKLGEHGPFPGLEAFSAAASRPRCASTKLRTFRRRFRLSSRTLRFGGVLTVLPACPNRGGKPREGKLLIGLIKGWRTLIAALYRERVKNVLAGPKTCLQSRENPLDCISQ